MTQRQLEKTLRYQEDGNVHLDFHGAVNTTIDFIVERYGIEVLHEIFAKVGKHVYRDLRQHMLDGDPNEMVRHWRHFFDRENADYDIAVGEDEIVLTVRRCTAYHHVARIAPAVSPFFCDQTSKVNEAIAEGSAYRIYTEITGPGACRQVIRRRA
jgi:predicted ArsR family transcriptional regulator